MPPATSRLSETAQGEAWLRQFQPQDVALATELLDRLVFVPSDIFRSWLAGEIIREAGKGRLALYGERELPPRSRFFPQLQPGKVRRAIGAKGPALVQPTRGSSFVGSEGIVAQLLSELVKRSDVAALLTPGPDRLRPQKSRGPTRRLAIVTDVIGSGTRIERMLDALWRTESVRSWRAHRKVDLEILIFAYSASAAGYERVQGHRVRPRLFVREIVPTVQTIVNEPEHFVNLCKYYEPQPTDDSAGPLGYGDAGTLVAFGHGCPNTTPPIFWNTTRRWRALFSDRSGVEFDALAEPSDLMIFSSRLRSLNRLSLSNPALLEQFDTPAREALVLLAAISRGRHHPLRLASRTGIEVTRVVRLLAAFRTAGWIAGHNGITAKGLAELAAAKKVVPQTSDVPFDRVSVYFPTSLRG